MNHSRERIEIKKTGEFRGHRSAIYTLSPSYRAGYLLSAGSEGVVAEWNLKTQEATGLAQTASAIFSMCLIPDRNLLALGQQDGGISFVDFTGEQPVIGKNAHDKSVFDLQVFPGGKYLLASGQGGFLSVWNLETLTCEHKVQVSPKSIRTLHIDAEKRRIFAGSSDHQIRLLDFDLKVQKTWEAGNLSIFRVKSPEGDHRIFSIGRDAHIRTWMEENSEFQPIQAIPAHMYAINDLVFHPGGRWFFTGSMDKSIKIWRKSNLELLKVIDFERHACHRNGVNRLLWHEDRLYSTGDDRLIMEWEISRKP